MSTRCPNNNIDLITRTRRFPCEIRVVPAGFEPDAVALNRDTAVISQLDRSFLRRKPLSISWTVDKEVITVPTISTLPCDRLVPSPEDLNAPPIDHRYQHGIYFLRVFLEGALDTYLVSRRGDSTSAIGRLPHFLRTLTELVNSPGYPVI